MKLLLVGNGGREHALARTLVRTSDSVQLIVQAGNPGIDALGEPVTFDPADPQSVTAIAQEHGVDLVVVGPEAYLVTGVADVLNAAGIPCFGPSGEASRLESSKSFAKEIMEAANVATAQAFSCTTIEQVEAAIDTFGPPYVVKDDGLAAGKGVVVTEDRDAALAHARTCLSHDGGTVVIEDYLDGPEVSLFCICDGSRAVPLMPAQDFKRLGDNNEGPNTGGMGAYTPLPWLPQDFVDKVVSSVAEPTLAEMAHRGSPFKGVLYCGLAITRKGIRVVEFNVRFGDPETQVVLERLDSSLAELLMAAATGALSTIDPPRWNDLAAVTVVMASPGYPVSAHTGHVISGVEKAEALDGVHVIHAGTRMGAGAAKVGEGGDKQLLTAGGRVLDVVGTGRNIDAARAAAYRGVDAISFEGAQYRSDIATWPDTVLA